MINKCVVEFKCGYVLGYEDCEFYIDSGDSDQCCKFWKAGRCVNVLAQMESLAENVELLALGGIATKVEEA